MDGYDFAIGLGDNDVVWSFPVFDAFGNPFDPHGATSVTLACVLDDGSAEAFDLAGATFAQAVSPDYAGRSMQAADFQASGAGVYLVQAVIVMPSGTRITYPENRRMRVLVTEAPA